MAWTITNPQMGIPGITNSGTSGVLPVPLGTVVQATDTTYGPGSVIFLYGCSSNIVGAVVTYNALTGATTLIANTANLGAPVAVSMVANTSTSTPSWYQISGAAVIKKTATKVNPSQKVYISGTAGRLMGTSASGKQVLNIVAAGAATVASATSTFVGTMGIQPVAQGQAA